MGKAVSNVLLGNNIGTIPKWDIYQSLSNTSHAFEEDMDLNESQKHAIRLGRAAPVGFLARHGPPGTVKSPAVTDELHDANVHKGKPIL